MPLIYQQEGKKRTMPGANGIVRKKNRRKKNNGTILVVGATGNQGRAIVDALLRARDRDMRSRFKIRAMVRDPTTMKARELKERGVHIVKGDMMDEKDMRRAVRGVSSVFLITLEYSFKAGGSSYNPSKSKFTCLQATQAKNVLEASKAEGVRHIVYSSALGVGQLFTDFGSSDNYRKYRRKSQIFLDKMIVEEMIKDSGLRYTILRPAYFMEMIVNPTYGISKQGIYPSVWKHNVKMAYTACRDIGRVGSLALVYPDAWDGREMPIVTQILTPKQIVSEIAHLRGESDEWEVKHTSRWMLKLFAKESALMIETYESLSRIDHQKWEEMRKNTALVLGYNLMDLRGFLLSKSVHFRPYRRQSWLARHWGS
ncbi:hypothetical protein AAMO2058_001077600 [Amorphochlora amoebiformis]